jgi:hypothetical protein
VRHFRWAAAGGAFWAVDSRVNCGQALQSRGPRQAACRAFDDTSRGCVPQRAVPWPRSGLLEEETASPAVLPRRRVTSVNRLPPAAEQRLHRVAEATHCHTRQPCKLRRPPRVGAPARRAQFADQPDNTPGRGRDGLAGPTRRLSRRGHAFAARKTGGCQKLFSEKPAQGIFTVQSPPRSLCEPRQCQARLLSSIAGRRPRIF